MKEVANNLIGNVYADVIQRLYIKNTIDFYDKVPNVELNHKITEVQLQCEGYGLFQPKKVLQNFSKFITQLSKAIIKGRFTIRTLKINFNGFKLLKQLNVIGIMYQNICSIGDNIKILWIHTSDLENVTFDDFRLLFKLVAGIQIAKNTNFQDYSLQCANWTFENQQPTFNQLQKMLMVLLEPYFDENGQLTHMTDYIYEKHFRLEISGWWYSQRDAKIFLQVNPGQKFDKDDEEKIFGKAVKQFHNKLQMLLNKLLEIMADIEYLELDMRNNHQLLQTKKLKQKLISSVSKTNRTQKSLMSMRQTTKIKSNEGQENQKTFRFNVMM